jgi:hypothetical protein
LYRIFYKKIKSNLRTSSTTHGAIVEDVVVVVVVVLAGDRVVVLHLY